MGKWLLRDRVLISLIILTILLKVFSLQPEWVERYYSRGFFVYSSRFLRTIFGWIPFSIGDILYLLAGVFLVVKIWKLIRLLIRRRWRDVVQGKRLVKYIKIALGIYLAFNICWGLNYDRQEVATQLGLQLKPYSDSEVLRLSEILHQKLNDHAALVDTTTRDSLGMHRILFNKGTSAFNNASGSWNYLNYRSPSIKPSLFSHLGHYFGFTGYINPFTNEAQVQTTQPLFRQPFVLTHEIAHQVGYGKEDEASFVAFLASKTSPDVNLRYSMYYVLYSAASGELPRRNLDFHFLYLRSRLHPRVKNDRRMMTAYYMGKENMIEPVMSDFYDSYLKMNKQPGGKETYNYVVALLIAYMNKYGYESL